MTSMRESFGNALVKIGAEMEELVVLDCDVSTSTKTALFNNVYPERFYNMGVAEANMADVAAGLATCGKKPVISAFAIFLALKSIDQIRNTICYTKLPVVIVGGYSGLSDSYDGASHQAITDIVILRAMPNLKIIVPSCAYEVEPVLRAALECNEPVYIRLCRNPTPEVPVDKNYSIGKASKLNDGSDITIGACGVPVSIALSAVKKLEEEGIRADLLNLSSIKPIDTDIIVKSTKKTGAFLSVEEHTIIGGLGSAVSEILSKQNPVPTDFIGIEDKFTESGSYYDLLAKYGISIENILLKAKKLIDKK